MKKLDTDRIKRAYSKYYKEIEGPIGGVERFLWIYNVLLKSVTGKAILDVGCGEGSILKILKDNGNYVFGIDVSETGQIACREKGIDCALIDVSTDRFPYDDNSFDIVVCFETLEHLGNPHHCIWEMKRVLKEKGIFVVSMPNPKISHLFIYPGLFDFKNFKKFLKLNSFQIIKIKGWGQASIINRFNKSRTNIFTECLIGLLYFLNRKANLLMRKYIGTPLCWCHSYNFVCLNHKKDKTLVERVADETCPKS